MPFSTPSLSLLSKSLMLTCINFQTLPKRIISIELFPKVGKIMINQIAQVKLLNDRFMQTDCRQQALTMGFNDNLEVKANDHCSSFFSSENVIKLNNLFGVGGWFGAPKSQYACTYSREGGGGSTTWATLLMNGRGWASAKRMIKVLLLQMEYSMLHIYRE